MRGSEPRVLHPKECPNLKEISKKKKKKKKELPKGSELGDDGSRVQRLAVRGNVGKALYFFLQVLEHGNDVELVLENPLDRGGRDGIPLFLLDFDGV